MKKSDELKKERRSLQDKMRELSLVDTTAGEYVDDDGNPVQEKQIELRNQIGAMSEKITTLSSQIEAALVAEDTALDPTVPASEKDPEQNELMELRSKTKLYRYLEAAVNRRGIQGAEAEFSEKMADRTIGDEGFPFVPFEMLDPGTGLEGFTPEQRSLARTIFGKNVLETRAATIPTDAENEMRDPLLMRIFAPTIMAFLDASMTSTGAGFKNIPKFESGFSGDGTTLAKNAQAPQPDTVFSAMQIRPTRVSASYLWTREDAAIFPGLEAALTSDIRTSLMDGVDRYGIVQMLAAITSSRNAYTGNAVSNWTEYAAAPARSIDGVYAQNRAEVSFVLPQEVYNAAAENFDAPGANVALAAIDYLERVAGGIRATPKIGLESAGGTEMHADAIAVRARNEGALMPMWGGFELVRDPYSNAREGQIQVTAVTLVGFGIRRQEKYQKVVFRTIAA